MIYYSSTAISFREVPNEIARCFSISECGLRCSEWPIPGPQGTCGEPLTPEVMDKLIGDDALDGVNVYAFLGEGDDREALRELLATAHDYGMLTCLYTSSDNISDFEDLMHLLDYIKIGHYDSELGGLDKETTNQRYYINISLDEEGYELNVLTYMFREDPNLVREI